MARSEAGFHKLAMSCWWPVRRTTTWALRSGPCPQEAHLTPLSCLQYLPHPASGADTGYTASFI